VVRLVRSLAIVASLATSLGACRTELIDDGAAAGGGVLSPAQLKYRLIDRLGELFFCDPDYWPVARADEQELALARFPEIAADTETFDAILQRLGWQTRTEFSPEEKLRIYREYKKLNAILLEPAGSHYDFRLSIRESKEGVSVYSGRIDERGRIDVREKTPGLATCPRCLPGDTRVDAPGGRISLRELRPGMLVWSSSPTGARIAVPILKTARVRVTPGHQLVRLRLSDGRELVGSPGHPTADGRALGSLTAGDAVDGARVLGAQRFASSEVATYDILPAGETATYWANGLPVASTLAPAAREKGDRSDARRVLTRATRDVAPVLPVLLQDRVPHPVDAGTRDH
jgi:hypothetical protein